MDVRFAFEDGGSNYFGRVWRPVAEVTLQSTTVNKKISIWMVVDTGADFTILPKHLSEKLRISLKKNCIKEVTYGVGGEQVIYLYKSRIIAKIGAIERKIPLAFFDSNEIPPLLGRLGFLETFHTEFLSSHSVVFRS